MVKSKGTREIVFPNVHIYIIIITIAATVHVFCKHPNKGSF